MSNLEQGHPVIENITRTERIEITVASGQITVGDLCRFAEAVTLNGNIPKQTPVKVNDTRIAVTYERRIP